MADGSEIKHMSRNGQEVEVPPTTAVMEIETPAIFKWKGGGEEAKAQRFMSLQEVMGIIHTKGKGLTAKQAHTILITFRVLAPPAQTKAAHHAHDTRIWHDGKKEIIELVDLPEMANADLSQMYIHAVWGQRLITAIRDKKGVSVELRPRVFPWSLRSVDVFIDKKNSSSSKMVLD